jgi:hypothetical protein
LARAENRDSLVVHRHRYFVVAGTYDWYWLFDRTGKREQGPIGEYESAKAKRVFVGNLTQNASEVSVSVNVTAQPRRHGRVATVAR